MGIAAPVIGALAASSVCDAAGVGPAPMVVEGAGIPEVRGSSETLDAPEKTADCVGAAGSAGPAVTLGLRTF